MGTNPYGMVNIGERERGKDLPNTAADPWFPSSPSLILLTRI